MDSLQGILQAFQTPHQKIFKGKALPGLKFTALKAHGIQTRQKPETEHANLGPVGTVEQEASTLILLQRVKGGFRSTSHKPWLQHRDVLVKPKASSNPNTLHLVTFHKTAQWSLLNITLGMYKAWPWVCRKADQQTCFNAVSVRWALPELPWAKIHFRRNIARPQLPQQESEGGRAGLAK